MPPAGARERELHRYYQPWLDTFISDLEPTTHLPPPPVRTDSHRPRSSRDKALTAFAQLGCLRLNAKRGVVTLIDSEKQYIIAEATKSLSLLNDSQHAPGDELWFGNSYLSRDQGVSQDAMYPETCSVKGSDGSVYSAQALIVNDLARHPVYRERGYSGAGVSFYCGVPLKTRLGHVIGVYNVTDDKPRDSLSPDELRFMVDMSTIVVEHLEVVKNDRARARGERLIHGIGTFIEGQVTTPATSTTDVAGDDPQPDDMLSDLQPSRNSKANTKPVPSRDEYSSTFKGLKIGDANLPHRSEQHSSARAHGNAPPPTSRTSSYNAAQQRRPSLPVTESSDGEAQLQQPSASIRELAKDKAMADYNHVFDRAASILMFCLAADGVVFVDASSANLSIGSSTRAQDEAKSTLKHSRGRQRPRPRYFNSDRIPQELASESEPTPGSTSPESSDSNVSSASSRKCGFSTKSQTKSQKCLILGASGQAADIKVHEHLLRRFVRRYPNGKCLSFDQHGRPISSDESSGSASVSTEQAHSLTDNLCENPTDTHNDSFTETSPPKPAFSRAFPGARNLVFLPLWDFAKERWHSALIIWSRDASKLTNVHDDMTYLKAFNNAIMNEVNRINLVLSDIAKATFLANISHELRSPLHGILGSIEFLYDTPMDDFQASMLISVETCGKTLLDTVNHVLDYAKINNLGKNGSRSLGDPRHKGFAQASSSDDSLTIQFNLATIVEEVVEAVYAGQVFRSAQANVLEGHGPLRSSQERAINSRERSNHSGPESPNENHGSVILTLDITDHTRWNVRSQPGAVRRVVMNILGNALKYTQTGSINVSLKPDESRRKIDSRVHAVFTVTDTGQGMSGQFVKNHAFTAFSQEDSLASGTGLGLSIVRQIVDSLGGRIQLTSEKGIGTEIKVSFSLPIGDSDQIKDQAKSPLAQMQAQTQDLELVLLEPPAETKSEHPQVRGISPMPSVEDSVRKMLAKWFKMQVRTASNMDERSPNFFMYLEPPPIDLLIERHGTRLSDREIPVIIICTNAFQAASLRANGIHHLTDLGRIIEVVPQPLGPQKLAKALMRAMQRMKMLEDPKVAHSSRHVPLDVEKGNIFDATPEGPRSTASAQGKVTGPQRRSSQNGEDIRTNGSNPPGNEIVNERHRGADLVPNITHGQAGDPLPHVLVVDDNNINLNLLVAFVRRTKHPFESAVNGLEALNAYKRSAVDAGGIRRFKYILMDISMPVMDGIASTQAMRQFERENNISEPATIIALTGLGSESAQQEAFHAGFDRILSKPIRFKELQKMLF